MGGSAKAGLLRRAGVALCGALVPIPLAPVAADAATGPSRSIARLSGMQPAPLSRSGARLEKAAAPGSVKGLRLYFTCPTRQL